MKPTEEQRLGKIIITAQERVRLCLCRSGTAAQWHLAKAGKVVLKPKLLQRVAPHLERDEAKQYLAALPALIEETKLLDTTCGDMWNRRRADYIAERDRLVTMLARYDFSLRSYEKLARQPSKMLAEALATVPADDSPMDSGAAPHDETAMRMTKQEGIELDRQINKELHAIDEARAELVAAHGDLVIKLAQKSGEPIDIVTPFAQDGLLKAAENFDVRRGHRFTTYAQWWIKTAIEEKKTWDK